jgi:hypothetical protein
MGIADCLNSRPAEEFDVTTVIATALMEIQESLSELDARISQLSGQLKPVSARKEWYSIAELATELGKAEFTVREWCRLKRINAHKRECGRGGKREWMIAEKELERIRNKGLLPVDL